MTFCSAGRLGSQVQHSAVREFGDEQVVILSYVLAHSVTFLFANVAAAIRRGTVLVVCTCSSSPAPRCSVTFSFRAVASSASTAASATCGSKF